MHIYWRNSYFDCVNKILLKNLFKLLSIFITLFCRRFSQNVWVTPQKHFQLNEALKTVRKKKPVIQGRWAKSSSWSSNYSRTAMVKKHNSSKKYLLFCWRKMPIKQEFRKTNTKDRNKSENEFQYIVELFL